MPGVSASFAISSDRAFSETSWPLNGSPFCVSWQALVPSWVNQPGLRIV
jgi:hypothetical protein